MYAGFFLWCCLECIYIRIVLFISSSWGNHPTLTDNQIAFLLFVAKMLLELAQYNKHDSVGWPGNVCIQGLVFFIFIIFFPPKIPEGFHDRSVIPRGA